jgi:hypothetical protein
MGIHPAMTVMAQAEATFPGRRFLSPQNNAGTPGMGLYTRHH